MNDSWPSTEFCIDAEHLLSRAKHVLFVGLSAQTLKPWPSSSLLVQLVERCPVTVLEIWKPYLDAFPYYHPNLILALGDVWDFQSYSAPDTLLVWLHGPEHTPRLGAQYLVKQMADFYQNAIFETPDGEYPQGEIDGNPYQAHRSVWTKEDFWALSIPAEAFTNEDGTQVVLAVKQ